MFFFSCSSVVNSLEVIPGVNHWIPFLVASGYGLYWDIVLFISYFLGVCFVALFGVSLGAMYGSMYGIEV